MLDIPKHPRTHQSGSSLDIYVIVSEPLMFSLFFILSSLFRINLTDFFQMIAAPIGAPRVSFLCLFSDQTIEITHI